MEEGLCVCVYNIIYFLTKLQLINCSEEFFPSFNMNQPTESFRGLCRNIQYNNCSTFLCENREICVG